MRRPVLFLAVARSALEAVIFACPAAVLHAVTGGRDALPMLATLSLCFGASLILVAVLRDARAERQNVFLTVGVIGGAIVLALAQPTRETDGLAVLTRIVGFGVLAEAFIWRTLSVARSVTRWNDARTASVLTALSLAAGALVPGIDSEPLPGIALLAVGASALSLSLARSTEELDMAGRSARGTASGRTAAGSAFVLGALAIVAALSAPALRSLFAAGGDVLGPMLSQLLYWIALPFGYLAAALVPLFRPLADWLFGGRTVVEDPGRREQEQLMLEALEQTRPFVFGAVELVVALFAVIVGVVLIDRLTRERRSALPDGATLERAAASGGLSLGSTLRGLLPARARARRRPGDDGSTAAAVRLLYWRFLELAERAGAGWRATAETPAEHQTRLRLTDPRWEPAAAIVDAFERVRYGEVDPPADIVESARGALAEIASHRA
ncbi:MAG TPA: DUF4129 domain-containing protein [Candidatus Limnocylindria bacterium]|nr:DUF4129 domain-containing protein [Candidatus Limnocylindria bacterium]